MARSTPEEEEVKSPSSGAKVVVRVVTLTMTINYAQNVTR